ncbi:nitrilase-related carbon-nitrogen hydrolase [Streptomyces sp. NPDC057199]|uniref:nitrilase-related carbon-nitrogen hydrolase n=1 Tax=Streptomyces sp. NPDC057199 TaxID=3346047 RepID=UPI003635EF8F
MSRTLTVAAVNFVMRPLKDFEDFADQVTGLLSLTDGADLVVFPEMFTTGLITLCDTWPFDALDGLVELAAFESRVDQFFAQLAAERRQFILAGSTLSATGDGFRNVATLHGPEGIVLRHSKTQLLPVEKEFVTERGSAFNVVDIGKARVGVNICYEIQFPEGATALVDQGAEVIICPALTTSERGFWRVRHAAHARAVENQVYVVHSAAGGQPKHALPGGFARTAIISPCDWPWENVNGVIAETATNASDVVITELDLDALEKARDSGETRTFRDRRQF